MFVLLLQGAAFSMSGLSLIVIYSFVNPARVVQWSALHQEAQLECSNTSNGSFHTDKQYLCKQVLRLSQLTTISQFPLIQSVSPINIRDVLHVKAVHIIFKLFYLISTMSLS